MLDSTRLREVLQYIYDIDDKHLIPISTNWFVPSVDPEDKVGTWIGYRIQSVRPYARTYSVNKGNGQDYNKPVKVSFRLSFVGPQAEEFAHSTLMWDDRTDVQQAFEKSFTQINYNDRQIFSYPIRNGGYNDELCWIVDFTAQTTYTLHIDRDPWISN